jgi:hypothetical protein
VALAARRRQAPEASGKIEGVNGSVAILFEDWMVTPSLSYPPLQ